MKPLWQFVILLSLVSSSCLNHIHAQNSACQVISVLPIPQLPLYYSPDSTKYLVNVQDTSGVYQIYIGNSGDTTLTCISLNGPRGLWRPCAQRNKMQVQWHASGKWIICAVEKDYYNELLYVPYSLRLGFIESGTWMDIWAVTPDGSNWYNLDTTQGGFTGPAFTPDGNSCAWAEAQNGSNFTVDVFGVWKLWLSGFADSAGIPVFRHSTDITPAGARWIEPGNFANDGERLLISSDIGMYNAQGQDQFILNVTNRQLINLTNSPMEWDEHGVWSRGNNKILFMSSYPYRADTNSYHTTTLKTEFMLMNPDGNGLQQLTHFGDTGYVESSNGIAATGYFGKGDSSIYCQSLVLPNYDNWMIKFAGNCGGEEITAVQNVPKGDGLLLYPNPAGNTLNLRAGFDLQNAQITTFNTLGQMIKSIETQTGSELPIDLNGMANGVYFLQIRLPGYSINRTFVKAEL